MTPADTPAGTPADAGLARQRVLDELARQYAILDREKRQRLLLTWFAFALCAFYLNPWLLLVLATIDTLCELANIRLLKGLDPWANPRRYRGTILCVVLMECSFGAAAAMVWQVDNPYAKAFGAGMIMTTALQLTTIRSIHLPYGISGIAAISVTAFLGIVAHGVATGDLLVFGVSFAAATGGIGYALVAMLSNHDLHRITAEGREVAQAADAQKSRFLAQMSHELRTPLNAIIGLGQVELSQATKADPASLERLETLVASARGLAVVLDDALDLSSITDGRLVLRPRPVRLDTELDSIVATFRNEARIANVTLALDLARDLPAHVVLDPQRLRQCILNLLCNALKHVRDGGVTVSANADGKHLVIDVADTGTGVAPHLRDAIFEPFRQGDANAPGSGLGLAISRSLARQMGGDLVLVPSNVGATFRLTLDAPATDAPRQEPAADVPDLANRTILVVDDIATNRLVAASFLRLAGAHVLESDGGHDALRQLAHSAVDLVLLDMNMPGLDGISTFQAIRAMEGERSRIPVIAMTADALASQRALIAAEGLDGYLPKPLVMDDLHAMLHRHLGQHAASQPKRTSSTTETDRGMT